MNRFLGAASLVFLLAGGYSHAFVVNDIGDASDANPGDGFCDIPIGGPPRCTLRAAIEEANAFGGGHLIEFSVGLFTITPSTPLPTITTNGVTIDATTAPGYNSAATSVLDATPLVRLSGSALSGTTADGLRVANAAVVRIKGLAIYDFPDNGIEAINSSNVEIDSNWIGVRHDESASGNGGSGVFLSNCDICTVGTKAAFSPTRIVGRGNLISSNAEDGIFLQLGEDSLIAGNYIGVSPAGSDSFGNVGHGIQLLGPDNVIGLVLNSEISPNYIGYNGGDGIRAMTGGQKIYINQIMFNSGNGIALNGANSEIGDTVNLDRRNLIAANAGHGIHVGNALASHNNAIENNWIYENLQRGVQLSSGSGNTITSNQVFNNDNDAIYLADANNAVESNNIGLLNTTVVGNAANGVVLAAGGNTVENNVIGAVDDDGVDVVSGSGNVVSNNLIGMRSDGTDIGVGNAGVRVRNGPTDTSISYNRIGNNFDGIALEGTSTRVCGNFIGVGDGLQNAGNASEGVRIDGGGNRIGDPDAGCDGNLVGFNGSDGIQIAGDANIVRSNTVGGVTFSDLGNLNAGVFVANGSDLNLIRDNNLHHNGNDGIRVAGAAGTRNRFDSNHFGENGDRHIDLGDNGATANDPGDGDSGPNNLQNYPEITGLASIGGQLEIRYRIDSALASSSYPLTVDFYVETNLQRDIYRIHRDVYSQTPNSIRTILIDPPFVAELISALVIDIDGNTSELSPPLPYEVVPATDDIFGDRFELP